SSSDTAALGSVSAWMDQAPPPLSPVSGCGMASDGPSSHGLCGGAGGFAAGGGRCPGVAPGFAFFAFGSGAAGFAACRGAGAAAGVAGAAAAGWGGGHGGGADPVGAVARPPGALT